MCLDFSLVILVVQALRVAIQKHLGIADSTEMKLRKAGNRKRLIDKPSRKTKVCMIPAEI